MNRNNQGTNTIQQEEIKINSDRQITFKKIRIYFNFLGGGRRNRREDFESNRRQKTFVPTNQQQKFCAQAG